MNDDPNSNKTDGKKSTIKILEERDKSLLIQSPPNFYDINNCFEYAVESGVLNPTKKLEK